MKTRMIIMAPDGKIEMYREKVDKLLELMGHPEALVTDESTVGDFISPIPDIENTGKILDRLADKLGFRVYEEDYIWELAYYLED